MICPNCNTVYAKTVHTTEKMTLYFCDMCGSLFKKDRVREVIIEVDSDNDKGSMCLPFVEDAL